MYNFMPIGSRLWCYIDRGEDDVNSTLAGVHGGGQGPRAKVRSQAKVADIEGPGHEAILDEPRLFEAPRGHPPNVISLRPAFRAAATWPFQ